MAVKKKKSKKETKKGDEGFDQRATMVAALAHEIKNPLNSIKGAGQYIHDRYGEIEDIREFSGIIIQEIERLERYLNEFLSFSRGVSLRLKKTRPESYIYGVIMLTKHSMPCGVVVKTGGKKIPEVYIDHEQIMQVMLNLLSNAADALCENRKPRIEILVSYDKKYVYITVKDNGRGIPRGKVNKVLAPFYTDKEEGLGIGLSISNAIIKRHGGEIKIKSSVKKGTEVTFGIARNLKGPVADE